MASRGRWAAWANALLGAMTPRAVRLVAVALPVVLASAATAGRATAQDTEFVERYAAPPECAARSVLEEGIARLVETALAPVRASVTIVPYAHELEALVVIATDAGEGRRRLRARRCEVLLEAVALVIAIAVDPSAVGRAAPPSDDPARDVPADPEPPAADPLVDPVAESSGDGAVDTTAASVEATDASAAVEAPSSSEFASAPVATSPIRDDERPRESRAEPELAFVLDAHLLGAAGILPGPTYGAALGVGARIAAFEVTLGGIVLAETRAQLEGTSRGGDFGLAAARLRLGYAFVLAPVELVPAIVLDLGATWGRGFGVSRPGAGAALTVEVGVGLEGRFFILSELAISVFAQLLVPFLRPQFVLTGIAATPVFQAFDVGGALGLGLFVRTL